MNQKTIIGFATENDAELIAKLGKETFYDAFVGNPLMPQDDLKTYVDTAFTVSQIASELKDSQNIFLLAQTDGEYSAYAKLVCGARTDGVTGKNPIKLQRLYARQKFIGAGIGAGLMKRCLAEAAAGNHDVMWLSSWKHNLAATKFYERFGFEKCGTFEFQLGKTTFIDILMQCEVNLIGNKA